MGADFYEDSPLDKPKDPADRPPSLRRSFSRLTTESPKVSLSTKRRCSVGSVLFGIESSAPQKSDFFGDKHGADAKSKATSAFGKRKWADYRPTDQGVPAQLG